MVSFLGEWVGGMRHDLPVYFIENGEKDEFI